jgi:hypothetical protein
MLAALAGAAAACGKKGPPLAPIIRVPAAVQTISAARIGADVYVTLTIPSQNVDQSMPAEVSRVDVYGVTAVAPPARGRFLERGALVASVAVTPPVREGEPVAAALPGSAAPGVPVTVRDTLEPPDFVVPPPVAAAPPDGRQDSPGLVAAAPPAGALRRFYMALALTERGRPGPQGAIAELPLTVLPDPPGGLTFTYTDSTITVAWTPSGGLIGFLLDRALPPEPPPFDGPLPAAAAGDSGLGALPAGPTLYNVYRELAPDPLELPAAAAVAAGTPPPRPANAAPVAALAYTEPLVLDGRERCYTVRALRGIAPAAIEGSPSAPACITPVDVFAPAAPAGLETIQSTGSISLIWEANSEPDLAGYLVLRGEAGGATLAPLTGEGPIADSSFTDETVMPGVRYVYEVVAVDNRLPLANVSAPARVEATAR